jgi:hypothetical protein
VRHSCSRDRSRDSHVTMSIRYVSTGAIVPPTLPPRCAEGYTCRQAHRAIVIGVTCCGYCERKATSMIVSNTEHVCLAHAIEFWTGLLGYARDHRGCCVKLEQLCTCPSCEDERLARSYLRDLAAVDLAAMDVGASPRDDEHSSIRLTWRTDFSAACCTVCRDGEAEAWLRDELAADVNVPSFAPELARAVHDERINPTLSASRPVMRAVHREGDSRIVSAPRRSRPGRIHTACRGRGTRGDYR